MPSFRKNKKPTKKNNNQKQKIFVIKNVKNFNDNAKNEFKSSIHPEFYANSSNCDDLSKKIAFELKWLIASLLQNMEYLIQVHDPAGRDERYAQLNKFLQEKMPTFASNKPQDQEINELNKLVVKFRELFIHLMKEKEEIVAVQEAKKLAAYKIQVDKRCNDLFREKEAVEKAAKKLVIANNNLQNEVDKFKVSSKLLSDSRKTLLKESEDRCKRLENENKDLRETIEKLCADKQELVIRTVVAQTDTNSLRKKNQQLADANKLLFTRITALEAELIKEKQLRIDATEAEYVKKYNEFVKNAAVGNKKKVFGIVDANDLE